MLQVNLHGAGLNPERACDLAIASAEATFATPGVKIGLFCTTPMVALSRAVGRKRAMEMLLSGRVIDAPTAADWGLVNRVVPPAGLAAGAATPERGLPAARAEVQIELCSPLPDIERSLKLRPDGDPFEVWLFDDAALTLFERGVRIRLRTKGKHAELTVKVANQDCARIDPKMVPPKIGKCEFDVHGASMAGAVSLSRNLSDKAERRAPRRIFFGIW